MVVERQETSAVAVTVLVRFKPIEIAQQPHLVSSAHHGTRRRFAYNCRGIGGIVAHHRSDYRSSRSSTSELQSQRPSTR